MTILAKFICHIQELFTSVDVTHPEVGDNNICHNNKAVLRHSEVKSQKLKLHIPKLQHHCINN